MKINTELTQLYYNREQSPIHVEKAKITFSLYEDDGSYIAGDMMLYSTRGVDLTYMDDSQLGVAALEKLKSTVADFHIPQATPKNITVDTTKTSVTIGGE